MTSWLMVVFICSTPKQGDLVHHVHLNGHLCPKVSLSRLHIQSLKDKLLHSKLPDLALPLQLSLCLV